MEIKVLGRKRAERLFSTDKNPVKVNIISIYSKNSAPAKIVSGGEIRFICFNDTNTLEEGSITEEQAIQIVEFVENLKHPEYPLYVHCDVGISMSSGVAAAIMKAINENDDIIFSNNTYVPNMTSYRKVLNAFYNKNVKE